jgi:hypothetical protein
MQGPGFHPLHQKKRKRNKSTDPETRLPELMMVKNSNKDGYRWLTPVILAAQETEIRRIKVQSQSGQIVQETQSQKTLHKKGTQASYLSSTQCLSLRQCGQNNNISTDLSSCEDEASQSV